VDSGNLAGHLIALRQACLELIESPRQPRLWPVVEAGLALAGEAAPLRPAHEVLAAVRGMVPTPELFERVAEPLRTAVPAVAGTPAAAWVAWTLRFLKERSTPPEETAPVAPRLQAIAERAYAYAMEMDFRFLFDPERRLFAIGFQQATHSLDASYYDLLASEARLASFLAVAKNDVPAEHWFRLGRTLTFATRRPVLVSWSGSMFEYLMPVLVMRSFPFTLLAQTYDSALARQVAYGGERGVPWGVSESAYNVRDRHQVYQYRAFGVPDLAL
jgi:cyclic beta-1,2-glucan synthetase